jgi:tripartite-type tricarboxylate transporter receptor subunit TctC
MRHLSRSAAVVVVGVALLSMAGATRAQSPAANPATAFPSKPVFLVIPFTPGGATDNEAKYYTDKLQLSLGQPFLFDFKPGGGTTIGFGYVAKAQPDGYTLALGNSSFIVHPNFYPDLPYNVITSFAPVTQLSARATVMLASPAALPGVYTIADFAAWGKANPGKLNCGTAGQGAVTHIMCEALSSAMGIPITPVHYRGVAQGQVDLMAGRTQMSAGTLFNALPMIKSGKLRAIATMSAERSKLMPDLPTTFEQGIEVEFPAWLGVFAPAKTPPAIVTKLQTEMRKAVFSPDVIKRMESEGVAAVGSPPDVFRAKVVSEVARIRKVIVDRNIKPGEE